MCNWGLRNSGRHQAIKVLSQRREELWDLLRGKFMAVLSTLSAALLVLSSRTGLCWHFPLLCPGRQGGWRKPTRKPARCPNKCMISKSQCGLQSSYLSSLSFLAHHTQQLWILKTFTFLLGDHALDPPPCSTAGKLVSTSRIKWKPLGMNCPSFSHPFLPHSLTPPPTFIGYPKT